MSSPSRGMHGPQKAHWNYVDCLEMYGKYFTASFIHDNVMRIERELLYSGRDVTNEDIESECNIFFAGEVMRQKYDVDHDLM